MNIEAQKMRFEQIEESFSQLKKNRTNKNELTKIETLLREVYDQTFQIEIVETKRSDPYFVMSVFPQMSTIDNITASIVNEEPVNMIYELWKKNTSWIIEIDRKVLDDSVVPVSARECTALLLHEIGHIVNSNAIPTRLGNVLKFEYAKMRTPLKRVFKNNRFQRLLSLPVLDTCSFSSKNNLKKEYLADNYAGKLGYGQEIESVLSKFSSVNAIDPNNSLKSAVKFSTDMIHDFEQRRANISKEKLLSMSKYVSSPFVGNFLKETVSFYHEGTEDGFFTESKRQELFSDTIDKINESYYTEFFLGKKKLKKLDPYDIDYISVEIDKMETNDDKLLLLSYIQSKLDTSQYYIDILSNPKTAKKYEIPHTLDYVVSYREKILQLHAICLKQKIVPVKPGISVIYPKGYEG